MHIHIKHKIRATSVIIGALFSLTLEVSSSYAFNRVLTAEATKSNYWSSFISSHTSELTRGGESLLNALQTKISNNVKTISYDGLWEAYLETDLVPETTSKLWDMYGGFQFTYPGGKCGNYKNPGDCYNREHSIPKSWFNEKTPMYSDIVHVVPTDGKVNGMRSNYALGEVENATFSHSFPERSSGGVIYQTAGISKLGSGKSILGVSAPNIVFEPDDQYKGDFARIYMYFATRYGGVATSGNGSTTFKSTYPYLTNYGLALIKKWHEQDPVSQKEIERNNGIEATQGNRNPFVDYPEWADKIFNTSTTSENLEKLVMNSNDESLPFGSSFQLSVTPVPTSASASVSWSSNNNNVASVDSNGLVTIGNETGYALICATSTVDSSIKAYCNITSYPPSDVDVTSVNASNLSLKVNETKKIEVNYLPSNAYPKPTYTYDYDESFIDVDSNGNITALKEGTIGLVVNAYQDGVKKASTQVVIAINGDTAPDLGESASIAFKTSSSDGSTTISKNEVISKLISSGSEYISEVTGATRLYLGSKGVKLGSGSGIGSLSLSLSDDIKAKEVAGIALIGAPYSSDTGTLDLYLNNSSTKTKSFSLSDDDSIWQSTSSLVLSSLTIKTSSNRAYLAKIIIYFAKDKTTEDYDADAFSNEFYNSINCDVYGINKPTFKDGYSWDSLKGLYESIKEQTEKDKLINASYEVDGSGSGTIITPKGETSYIVAVAMYRYDYIINKYNQTSIQYEEFIEGRDTSFNGTRHLAFVKKDSLTLTIFIALTIFLISLISLIVLLILKRQKERCF